MRTYAKKTGWKLSDKELSVRSSKLLPSLRKSVSCLDELDVFLALQLEYKRPRERNCFDVSALKDDKRSRRRRHVGDHELTSSSDDDEDVGD